MNAVKGRVPCALELKVYLRESSPGPGAMNAVKGRVPGSLELKVQLKEEFLAHWS